MAKFTITNAYNVVSRITDTDGTQINVAETKRVLAAYHAVLSSLSQNEALSVLSAGVKAAEESSRESTKKLVKAAKREIKKVKK